jgi:hypothetical protein
MHTHELHGLLASLLLILAAPALLATTGCGQPGDRAREGCPADEICNPETPEGLRFYGAGLGSSFDNSPSAVAAGGRQSIRFSYAGDGTSVLPIHHVVSSDPTRMTAESTAQRSATVRGISPGSADLRVLDESERLIDRVQITTAQIATVEVLPPLDLILALAPTEAPVVYASGTTSVTLALLSASGGRLVDEDMRVTSTTTTVSQLGWDDVRGTFGAADVELTVEAGNSTFEAVVPHAGVIDDFELATWILATGDMDRPSVGAGDTLCVIPRSGGARVVGSVQVPVFRVDGVVVFAGENSMCTVLPGDLGTTVSVQVALGAASRTFVLDVDPDRTEAMPLVVASFEMPRITPRALGARAQLAWGLDLAE